MFGTSGDPKGLSPGVFERETKPWPIVGWPQATLEWLQHAIEQDAVDTDVITEVFDVAKIRRHSRRVHVDRRSVVR